jgi:putative ABC transport system permease protein
LGAVQNTVLSIYIWQMLILATVACAVGILVGYFGHLVLVDVLGGLVGVELPPPSLQPAFIAYATGFVTLMGFALPPLLHLSQVPALRVLRRDLGAMGTPGLVTYLSGLVALSLLILWNSPSKRLALYTLVAVMGALVVLAVIAWLLIRLLRNLQGRPGKPWRFGMMNIARRASGSVVQVVAFGLGIMALLLLSIIRGDLLDEWQASIPEKAPNRFVINLQPEQVEPFSEFFAAKGAPAPVVHPMIRGRLISINDKPVADMQYETERAQHLAQREFNLSWAAELASHNNVTAGKWWDVENQELQQYSVEQGIAETLGIQLGDQLVFDIGGELFSAEVSNFREVKWDSFQANFFVIASPGLLGSVNTGWMSSFYLAPDDYALLNDVVATFPNITVIDVAAIMEHVRGIISRVTLAVEYVFLFTLAAGLMVLYAGIQSTRDERLRESAIIRTMGGRRSQLNQALLAEFLTLGALSGIVAALIASVVSWQLATNVFDMAYQFNPWVWIWGIIGGAVGVGLAGMLGVRSVMHQAPLTTLRKINS